MIYYSDTSTQVVENTYSLITIIEWIVAIGGLVKVILTIITDANNGWW